MKRLLILILILLGLFFVFFYFSLGSQPKFVGEEVLNHVPNSELELTIKNNPQYASYVYVKGSGYVLKDRRIVLLVGKDTAKALQGDAIKNVEKDLESYWKWQILTGDRKIEDLASRTNQPYSDRETSGETTSKKGIFSRILDVFKVADAVVVIQDNAKTCDCDNDLLLLSGPDLHLISTTLNPDGGGIGSGTGGEGSGISRNIVSLKLPQTEPQVGYGQDVSYLVGIIDSGVNYGVEDIVYSDKTSSKDEVLTPPKMITSLNYNFIRNNTEVVDSFYHGTGVARIIIKNTSSQKMGVVALKTFDKNNVGNLYDNLCAILYAIKNNIKIVNASWGVARDGSIPVFEEVLRRAKDSNVVVICSAGNQKMNIDANHIFPACYADHSELGSNILCVTSKSDTVCQNWSKSGKKIDLTVKANPNCKHDIPNVFGNTGSIFEKGSSYATPYVTAGVVNYLISTPAGFSKSGYMGSLQSTSDIKKY
jgi:hypothetical protein